MKHGKAFLILLGILHFFSIGRAQYNTPQNGVWVFGKNNGLNFGTGSPVPSSTYMPPSEGSASVCDASGNLLFYSTGDTVYNRMGAVMPSHVGLTTFGVGAGSSTQGVLIVPVIGSSTQYYIFSQEFISTANGRLSYTIVDMTLDGGMGDVVLSTLRTPVDTMTSEKLIAIPGNNCNIWVVAHKRHRNVFVAYNITAAGVSAMPVVSASGVDWGTDAYTIGSIRASHDRRRIALGDVSNPVSPSRAFELHDFNPNTGVVSNCRVLETKDYYGVEFSPDDTKLYANEASAPGGIVQYDVSLPTTAAMSASKYYIIPSVPGLGNWRHLRLGPDNKIYFRNGTTISSSFLDCISSPNLAGAACGYVPNAVNLSPNIIYSSLPNIVFAPIAGTDTITGPSKVCVGDSILLSDSTYGGVWTSSNPGVARVGSATGFVTGLSAGTAVISYTVTNSCGTVYATKAITVNPSPGAIAGITNVCVGTTSILSNSVAGGSWSSSNPGVATIGPGTGLVTGIAAGATTISYMLPGGCFATALVTVIAFPDAGVITGPSVVCTGQTITLTNTTGTGVWSSSNTVRAIVGSSSGIVTGISAGTVTISYTVTYTCGSATAIKAITVNASPAAITGDSIICGSGTITLANAVAGGVWSSSDPGVASVGSASGIVISHSSGSAIITYIIGSCYRTKTITVDPLPDAGVILSDGSGIFCVGSSMNIWTTTTGGVWSLANGSAALSGSTLIAISPGPDTVFYIVSNSCGADTALFPVVISPPPPLPYGSLVICVGDTTILKDSITGGTWGGGGATVDIYTPPIDSCIIVGKSAGVGIITYSLSIGCAATVEVTVNPVPVIGVIVGPDTICKNAIVTLKDTISGGVWSVSPAGIVSIDSLTGAVTTLASGNVVVTYKIPMNIYGCANSANFNLTVISQPNFNVNSSVVNPKCFGDTTGSILLNIVGKGPYDYLWSTGDSGTSIINREIGMYSVMVTDRTTLCTKSDTFSVTEPDSLQILSEVRKDYCKLGQGSIALSFIGGTPPYTYLWTNKSSDKEITGLKVGSYSVTVTDMNNCVRVFSFTIEDSVCEGIIIHNGISPNGDGLNDTWVIEGIENFPSNKVQVFDKWGDKIFEQDNYKNDWAGAGKKSLLPDGTYYYLIKLNADNTQIDKNDYTGSLLIKR